MGNIYKYRHWDGKAYQHIDTAHSAPEKNKLLEKYRQKYKLVRSVVTDTVRGKPDQWFIYVHIPSMIR